MTTEATKIRALFYSIEQQIPRPFLAMIGDKLNGPKKEIILTVERLEARIAKLEEK
jgi:hypothetical protein